MGQLVPRFFVYDAGVPEFARAEVAPSAIAKGALSPGDPGRVASMFTEPTGPDLTADQVRDLDDRFFRSRPLEYFRSRIAALLAPTSPSADLTLGPGLEFAASLGHGEPADFLDVEGEERDLQVAVDAFALRHHAAESLVRLYHALAVAAPAAGKPHSTWALLADGPQQTRDLVREARECLASVDGRTGFWRLVLPPEVLDLSDHQASLDRAVTVAGRWLHHAFHLLTTPELGIDKAHNKIKHGLAIRAQDDELMLFSRRGPSAEGSMPLSAVTGEGVVTIVEEVSLAVLSRPTKHAGLELSVLNVPAGAVLAEAWMLASIHAAMFHLAARQHLEGRDEDLPPLIRLRTDPMPRDLLGQEKIMGIRTPLTTPRRGSEVARPPAIAWLDGTFQELRIDYAGARRAVIVDSEEPTAGST